MLKLHYFSIRNTCLATCLMLMCLPALATEAPKSICGGIYDTCRLIDPESGDPVSDLDFDLVRKFHEDRAVVRIGGRFGYVDKSGVVVIASEYDLAGPFYQGLAEVFIDGKAGVIDRSGRSVVNPYLYRAIPFTSEVLLVSTRPEDAGILPLGLHLSPVHHSRYESRDLDGMHSTIKLEMQGRFRLLHIRDGWINEQGFFSKLFNRAPLGHQVNILETDGIGLIAAREKGADKDAPWGLLDATGTWRVKPIYNEIGQFTNGLAIVQTSPESLYGAIDHKGQEVIPTKYFRLSHTRDGNFIAQDPGGLTRLEVRRSNRNARKEGKVWIDPRQTLILDRAGRPVGDHDLEDAQPIMRLKYGGPAIARVQLDGVWHGLTPKGTLVGDPLIETQGRTAFTCSSGVIGKLSAGQITLFGPNGLPLTDRRFKSGLYGIIKIKNYCPSSLIDAETGAVSVLRPNGQLVLLPPEYDKVKVLDTHGLAVRRDNKWGLLSRDGVEIVPPQYSQLSQVLDGVYLGKTNDRVEWIYADGTLVVDKSRLLVQRHLTDCAQGGHLDQRDGKWGIKDAQGVWRIKPEYEAITCFAQGFAWAPDLKDRTWCPITPDGQWHKKLCRETFQPAPLTIVSKDNLNPYNFDGVLHNIRSKSEYAIGLREDYPR